MMIKRTMILFCVTFVTMAVMGQDSIQRPLDVKEVLAVVPVKAAPKPVSSDYIVKTKGVTFLQHVRLA